MIVNAKEIESWPVAIGERLRSR